MPRPSREQIDDEILEAAATLFARHGIRETSVQRIADAVGYSKTGLLHRYPSKEALQEAVIDKALAAAQGIHTEVEAVPPGPERDRAALGGMAGLALSCPGMVALILSGLVAEPDSDLGMALEELGRSVFGAFATDPGSDPIRVIRVTAALGALAVTSIALRDRVPAIPTDVLVDVSYDALGHGRATTH